MWPGAGRSPQKGPGPEHSPQERGYRGEHHLQGLRCCGGDLQRRGPEFCQKRYRGLFWGFFLSWYQRGLYYGEVFVISLGRQRPNQCIISKENGSVELFYSQCSQLGLGLISVFRCSMYCVILLMRRALWPALQPANNRLSRCFWLHFLEVLSIFTY